MSVTVSPAVQRRIEFQNPKTPSKSLQIYFSELSILHCFKTNPNVLLLLPSFLIRPVQAQACFNHGPEKAQGVRVRAVTVIKKGTD
jgi:hypothetical protein